MHAEIQRGGGHCGDRRGEGERRGLGCFAFRHDECLGVRRGYGRRRQRRNSGCFVYR